MECDENEYILKESVEAIYDIFEQNNDLKLEKRFIEEELKEKGINIFTDKILNRLEKNNPLDYLRASQEMDKLAKSIINRQVHTQLWEQYISKDNTSIQCGVTKTGEIDYWEKK
jgi:uncharacterized protein (UPF0305 family)